MDLASLHRLGTSPHDPPDTVALRPRPALHLDAPTFRVLFEQLGPSLAVWRAAEIAALREASGQGRPDEPDFSPGFSPPILDLGCGDGLVTSLALKRVEIALDPDRNALTKAARLGVYERFQACLIEDAPLENGSLGTVLSNSVMEHIASIDAALAVIARLLRPGGRLVFTVPSEAFGRWLIVPSQAYACRRNRQLIHLNLWPTSEWARRLAGAGLQIVDARPYLRRRLVAYWDGMDNLERVWVARRRIVGVLWRRIPPAGLERLAARAARLDLSSGEPGGGRLIVAVKR
jgi:SAM-dependent methyltransferase